MRRVYPWLVIALMVLSSGWWACPVSLAQPGLAMDHPTQAAVDHLSNTLEKVAQQLQAVSSFDLQTVEQTQASIDSTLDEVKALAKSAKHVSETYGAQLKALGPAPKKGDPQEDPSTAERRKTLEKAFAHYDGLVSQAKASYVRGEVILRTLAEVRLTMRNRRLLTRGEPVFSFAVWHEATQQMSYLIKDLRRSTVEISNAFLKVMVHWAHVMLLSVVAFLSFFIMGPMARWLQKKYGERHPHVTPSLFRRLSTAFVTMVTHGILPMGGVLFLVFTLYTMHVFTPAEYGIIFRSLVMLGSFLAVLSLVHLLLSAKKPSWRVFDLSDRSALALDRRAAPFILLLALNAYITWLLHEAILGEALYTVFLLFLRTATCFLGLLLLQAHCWQPREKAAMVNGRSHVHPVMHEWVLTFLYLVALGIFLTNPCMVLFGYGALADALFSSFIKTGAIILLAFTLHLYMRESFARLLGVKGKKQSWISTQLGLNEPSRRIVSYWTLVILDSFVLLGAVVLIALSWGIDKTYLFNLLETLFFGIDFGKNHVSLISFFVAIGTFLFLFYLTRFLQRMLTERVFPYTNLDQGARHALKTGLGYIGFTLSLIIAISVFGIDLSSLAIIVGALSVGVGFGLQSAVGNFVAGIIMLIERPIKIGDRIVVGDVEGIVRRISVRATELKAFDESSILVPNSELINGRVRNWTFGSELNRVDVPIRVAYNVDPQRVKNTLIKVALDNDAIAHEPAPQVLFKNFGESSKDFLLQVFLKDINRRNRVDSELRYEIDKVFKAVGIAIPYPQRDIHIKKADLE